MLALVDSGAKLWIGFGAVGCNGLVGVHSVSVLGSLVFRSHDVRPPRPGAPTCRLSQQCSPLAWLVQGRG